MRQKTLIQWASACVLGVATMASAHAGTIRVTVPSYSDFTKTWLTDMAQGFEKANPGDKVKVEVVSWDNLQQKLQTDITGNNAPDLSVIGTRWLLDFVKDDIAEPLDGLNAGLKDRFIPSFLQPGKVDGKLYGLPMAASARALFYNKDMLAKAGFPEGPKTWDDVVAAAKKIKAAGGYGFGVQGKEIETDVYFYYALWSMGGDVVDGTPKATFNSPIGVKAATLYKSMIDQGLTEPGVTGYSREDLHNIFKQGRLGMVITIPPLAKQIAKDAPNLKYGITGLPNGGKDVTYGVTDSIMMFKSSKEKATAQKFLDYIFTKQARVKFDQTEGFLPVTKDVASDPAFAKDPVMSKFVSLLPHAKFAPLITGWEDTASAVSNAMQAIYLGKATPKAALDKAAGEANQKLGK